MAGAKVCTPAEEIYQAVCVNPIATKAQTPLFSVTSTFIGKYMA